jgi:hypothetical protein
MWVKRFKTVKHDKSNSFKIFDIFLVCYYSLEEYKTEAEAEAEIKKIKKLPYAWQNAKGETFLTAT